MVLQALPQLHTLAAGHLRLTILPIQIADEMDGAAFDAGISVIGAKERPACCLLEKSRQDRFLIPCDDLPAPVDQMEKREAIQTEIRLGLPTTPGGKLHPLPWFVLPKRADAEAALRFGAELRRRKAPVRVLVHCNAGLSRSPAVAILLAVQALGPERAEETVAAFFEAFPESDPQLWLVAWGDELLGCGGRLVAAVERATAVWQIPADIAAIFA